MKFKGLLAVTRDHSVRALSLTYRDLLFVIQTISNTSYVAVVRKEDYRVIDDAQSYVMFLRAFVSLIHSVANAMRSRYYTFLGPYEFDDVREVFRYKPYVDLMKVVSIRISKKAISVSTNDFRKRYKRTASGYSAADVMNVIKSIFSVLKELEQKSDEKT